MAAKREVEYPGPGRPGDDGDDEADPAELRALTSTRPSILSRRDDLLGPSNSACRKWLGKRFAALARGFEDQCDRSNDLEEYWNCYNCERDDNTYYKGEAEIYVPMIHDAVKALVTRWSNQLMPNIGRYVEVIAADGQQPYEIVALVNHYIKGAKFKANVLKPLIRNGIIEGQYNLYLDWQEITRSLVSRETHGRLTSGPIGGPTGNGPPGPGALPGALAGGGPPPPQVGGPPGGGGLGGLSPLGGLMPTPAMMGTSREIIDIREEDIVEGRPVFEVLHDSDVLVLPPTADSVDEALEMGGMAVIVRRFSKEAFAQLADEEDFDLGPVGEDGELPAIFSVTPEMTGLTDVAKKLVRDVGIKSRGRHAILFEVWQKVPLGDDGDFAEDDGQMRLCRTWYALNREPLSLKRNPHWNDRCPLLSQPVEKMAGVFKGRSQLEAVRQLQYEANDAANEKADVDHMAAMPIVLNKASEGNYPRLIAKGAIWDYVDTPPAILTFPDLGERGMGRMMAAQSAIFQSLSVNAAMISQSRGGGAKRNQAEVAQEQQVDLLTTAEEVEVLDSMLTEMVEFVVDMDHQYRDRPLTIRQYGELGVQAEMLGIPPLSNRASYEFQWIGAMQMRMNVSMTQNGTAFINVLRGMAQQLKEEGMQLRLAPIFEQQCASIFGPTIARRVLRDLRHELAVDPETENEMLREGHQVPVNMFDNDAAHLAAHQQAMQRDGDIYGTLRVHLQEHVKQQTMKNMAQQQQMMQAGGAPGVPGGAGPGVAGTPGGPRPGQAGAPPRVAGTPPGAVPMQPRMGPAMPGRIPPTAMPAAGATNVMPRRF